MTIRRQGAALTIRRPYNRSPGGSTFVGPLDALPAVTAAYSMRRLLASYTAGKAINVRRASDNATTDVLFLANGDLDVASLTTFLAATSGFITTWYDQSGGNLDLAQGTAANQPAIVAAETTMNSRTVGSYLIASSQSLTRAATPNLVQPFTISVVAERTAAFTTLQCIVGPNTQDAGVHFDTLANNIQLYFGTSLHQAGITDSVAHAVVSVVNGASSKVIYDQTIGSTAAAGAVALTGLRVSQHSAGSRFVTGFIGEVVLFPSAVADATVQALQVNQKAYWGTV